MAGALISSLLLRWGWSLNSSRKLALGLAAAIMPSALLVARAPLAEAIAFVSLAFLGHQFWSTILQALRADLFPSSHVGSVAGVLGARGSFGGLLFNAVAGWWLGQTHSYTELFLIGGLLHPLSFVMILVLLPRIRQLRLEG